MTVSGSWNARNLYTGSAKWGNALNPIHAVRDNGRAADLITAKEAPLSGAAGTVPEEIINDYGYCDGDYFGAVEDPRMVETHPLGREYDRSQIPANYPEWGDKDEDQETAFRSVPHESAQESSRVSSTFIGGNVSGGWLNKIRGQQNAPVTSDPKQYEINTSMTQGAGVQMMTNTRAQERGLPARSPIQSRTAGMREKYYAKSWEQGGGIGTPQMFPFQQTMLKRPFYYRTSDVPPDETHYMNTMEARQTLQYVSPDNPAQGQDATQITDNYGYTAGDYYG